MKIISKIFVVVLALLLELAILQFFCVRSHGMVAEAKYRHAERFAALGNYMLHPTPETKATFEEELRLMHKHENWKSELGRGLLVVIIVINVAGIYYYLRYWERK